MAQVAEAAGLSTLAPQWGQLRQFSSWHGAPSSTVGRSPVSGAGVCQPIEMFAKKQATHFSLLK